MMPKYRLKIEDNGDSVLLYTPQTRVLWFWFPMSRRTTSEGAARKTIDESKAFDKKIKKRSVTYVSVKD